MTMDPFVACCCCNQATQENYLLAPERQRMDDISRRLGISTVRMPTELDHLVLSFLPQDKKPPLPKAQVERSSSARYERGFYSNR